MAFTRENPEVSRRTFERVSSEARSVQVIVGSHDDDSPDRCRFMHSLGAQIGEFPATMEAAETARALGMTIVAGAPNIVRGASHSGNVSALALVSRGLCDVLVADYHAPALLRAVEQLVKRHVLSLQAAVALVSSAPARVADLPGQGEITIGAPATFTLVDCAPGRPWQVAGIVRNGQLRARFLAASEESPAA